MARINLLPWREELRRERQRQFLISLVSTAVLGVLLIFLVGSVYDQKIKRQNVRNDLLKSEIQKLEVKIKKISQLERTRSRLLSRKQVIEQLQASRSITVELLDQLAKSIPAGITLVTVTQRGKDLSLTGTSQSNARVSAYLQTLDENDLFLSPELGYVRAMARATNATEPYEFSIKTKLRSPQSGDDEDYDGQTGQGTLE